MKAQLFFGRKIPFGPLIIIQIGPGSFWEERVVDYESLLGDEELDTFLLKIVTILRERGVTDIEMKNGGEYPVTADRGHINHFHRPIGTYLFAELTNVLEHAYNVHRSLSA